MKFIFESAIQIQNFVSRTTQNLFCEWQMPTRAASLEATRTWFLIIIKSFSHLYVILWPNWIFKNELTHFTRHHCKLGFDLDKIKYLSHRTKLIFLEHYHAIDTPLKEHQNYEHWTRREQPLTRHSSLPSYVHFIPGCWN